MKEFLLEHKIVAAPLLNTESGAVLPVEHHADEIGKLFLIPIGESSTARETSDSAFSSAAVQHSEVRPSELPLTTLLNIYPDKRVYAFHGQMGAGKTTFVKQLCEELGVTDIVNSPTFAIVNVYDLPARKASHPHGSPAASETSGLLSCSEHSERSCSEAVVNLAGEIYHFDCYRIKDLREAYDMGTEEYLYSGNYCFIEWPEMIEELLPEDTVHVTLTVNPDNSRTLSIKL